jgi:hypothetical protein
MWYPQSHSSEVALGIQILAITLQVGATESKYLWSTEYPYPNNPSRRLGGLLPSSCFYPGCLAAENTRKLARLPSPLNNHTNFKIPQSVAGTPANRLTEKCPGKQAGTGGSREVNL